MDIQYHILGVLAYCRKGESAQYTLPPIAVWTKEFCDILNGLEFGKNNLCLSTGDNLVECKIGTVAEIFREFPKKYRVKSIYISKLPGNCEFVHFGNTVILSENKEEYAQKCADSIYQGLGFLKSFKKKLEELKGKASRRVQYKKDKEDYENIAKFCALQVHFNINNNRSAIGADHTCWNELLQNVDDHIANNGELYITLGQNSLSLSYAERGTGGFTVKDFVAICTLGNSGNVSAGQGDDGNVSATGHKGTGFKSVYNIFDKITIESGKVRCILDDTVQYDYSNCMTGDDFDLSKRAKIKTPKDQPDNSNSYFPVPEFEFLDEELPKTTITFRFKSGSRETFEKEIGLSSNDPTQISECYYFLHHIKKITYNRTEFDLAVFRRNTFYFYEETFYVNQEFLNKNPRWTTSEGSDRTEEFIGAEKNKVQYLFPKKNLPDETPLFCTLPIGNERYKIPFYINCPALELENSRNSLNDSAMKEWNSIILEYITGICFQKAFKKFADDHLEIAWNYFPYNYIKTWDGLEQIKFLRTVDSTETVGGLQIIPMSLSQWYSKLPQDHQTMTDQERKNGFVILPQYVYEWFKRKKGFDGYKTSVPFLYYEDTLDWFDSQENGLVKKIYDNVCDKDTSNKTLKQLFCEKGKAGRVVLDFKNFFEEKFYTQYDGISNIEDEDDRKFCEDILKKFFKDELFFCLQYAKYFCYRWYLGHTICEQKFHSLQDIEVPGWKFIEGPESEGTKTKCRHFFGELDDEMFKLCFPNLRDKLYFKRDWDSHTPVQPDDPFLKDAFSQNGPAKMFRFNKELEEASEDLKGALFEQGKVAVKLGNDKYILSNEANLFTTSKEISKAFILAEPEWAASFVDDLDDEMRKANFYEHSELEFLQEVVPAYQSEIEVAEAICSYLERKASLAEKEQYLFKQLIDWGTPVTLLWNKKYQPMLKLYDERVKEKRSIGLFSLHFQFSDSQLTELPDYIRESLRDRLSEDEYKRYERLSGLILYSTLANSGYCLGVTAEKPNDFFVVFSERGLGQFLRDCADIQAYLSPKQYTSMSSCSPLPLFRPYDTDLDQLSSIALPAPDAYDVWKSLLLKRYEWRDTDNHWHCSAGYGDPKLYHTSCPICEGKIIVEASALGIRKVRLCDKVHIPVLLCRNCMEAFKYSSDVYFCVEPDNPQGLSPQEAKEKLKKSETMHICFQLSGHSPKIYPMQLTLVHRKIALEEITKRTEDKNDLC